MNTSRWALCGSFRANHCHALGALFTLLLTATIQAAPGLFTGNTDIGNPAKPGSILFDESAEAYLVSGGGENMWFTNDAFHFAWQRLSGDFSLSAAIEWIGSGGNAHRKACLMVRQDLTPGSACVYVAVHGDGLTSLQFREGAGAMTREIQANVAKPLQASLERQSNTFLMRLSRAADGPLANSGAFMRIPFTDPVYVGIGVCAHDDQAIETAKFSRVQLRNTRRDTSARPVLYSTLEVVPLGSRDRRVVYQARDHFEAPNWSRDGQHLLFNSQGRIYRLPVTGGQPERIDTGFAVKCNNDHGLSPDGQTLVISDQSENGKSMIYTLPATGGTPRKVTSLGPSYWHGWSPDGQTLAYCAERGGEYDVYTIPVNGGEERRLTTAKGLDDGPDYSPDGKHIYFNSDRTGSMQIWRMLADGSEQEQVTRDGYNNWFPHPSPDGRWIVFLSYERDVTGHPANQPVQLRLWSTSGGPVQGLIRLFGGQGTINVPSWSPDSRQVAFVSYELLHE